MKKKIFAIAVLIVCLSLSVGGTLAFFTTSKTARNVIEMGAIEVELVQKGEGGAPFENAVGVIPGKSVADIVTVKNISVKPCWVRVKADKAIKLAEGVVGVPDTSLVTLDLNTIDWTLKDGYYYYNNVLAADAETEPLFTKVTFSTAMGNLYKNATAEIDVTAQAVQYANNGTTVDQAAGWPSV